MEGEYDNTHKIPIASVFKNFILNSKENMILCAPFIKNSIVEDIFKLKQENVLVYV